MPQNDFLTFGTAAGANVEDQASYAAAGWRGSGFLSGLAQSIQLNKVWRQAAFVASSLAQFISNTLGADVLDNGDQAAFITQLGQALSIAAGARGAREVTQSVDPVTLLTDYAIGFNRTAGVADTPVALPAGAVNGQSFKYSDLAGNFNAHPITVTPPAGTTIAGQAHWVCNEDFGAWEFRFFSAGNIWSVE
jgi:hypothetical protein